MLDGTHMHPRMVSRCGVHWSAALAEDPYFGPFSKDNFCSLPQHLYPFRQRARIISSILLKQYTINNDSDLQQ